MKKFTIHIPPHMQHRIRLETLSFEREQDAIEALIQTFTQKNIIFKLKQTKDRKAFISFQEGELASIVST
jgi:hypothetical protein